MVFIWLTSTPRGLKQVWNGLVKYFKAGNWSVVEPLEIVSLWRSHYLGSSDHGKMLMCDIVCQGQGCVSVGVWGKQWDQREEIRWCRDQLAGAGCSRGQGPGSVTINTRETGIRGQRLDWAGPVVTRLSAAALRSRRLSHCCHIMGRGEQGPAGWPQMCRDDPRCVRRRGRVLDSGCVLLFESVSEC